jgi:hypothetical protein
MHEPSVTTAMGTTGNVTTGQKEINNQDIANAQKKLNNRNAEKKRKNAEKEKEKAENNAKKAEKEKENARAQKKANAKAIATAKKAAKNANKAAKNERQRIVQFYKNNPDEALNALKQRQMDRRNKKEDPNNKEGVAIQRKINHIKELKKEHSIQAVFNSVEEDISKLHIYIKQFQYILSHLTATKNEIDERDNFSGQNKGIAIRILKDYITYRDKFIGENLNEKYNSILALNNNTNQSFKDNIIGMIDKNQKKFNTTRLQNRSIVLFKKQMDEIGFSYRERVRDQPTSTQHPIDKEKFKNYYANGIKSLEKIKNINELFKEIKRLIIHLYRKKKHLKRIDDELYIISIIDHVITSLKEKEIIHGIAFTLRFYRMKKLTELRHKLSRTGRTPLNKLHEKALEKAQQEYTNWKKPVHKDIIEGIPETVQRQIVTLLTLYEEEYDIKIKFSYLKMFRRNLYKASENSNQSNTQSLDPTKHNNNFPKLERKGGRIYTGSRGGKYMLKGGKKVYL